MAAGEIRYVIGGGRGGFGGGGSGDDIAAWVQAHFATGTAGGQSVYDLTKATPTS